MPKFNIGSRVKVAQTAGFSRGAKGAVVETPEGFTHLDNRIFVLRDGASSAVWFFDYELKLDDSEVHRTHCCVHHGCKYNQDDCDVVLGKVKQAYSCESCEDDHQNDSSSLEDRVLELEKIVHELQLQIINRL
jgi:hypothetical protein